MTRRVTVGFAIFLICVGVVHSQETDPGALIQVTMDSRVGVLLDEIPSTLRNGVAESLLNRPQAFWHDQARMQIEYTLHRLINRATFYPAGNKFQLPLPPPQVWAITTSLPVRSQSDNHDLVTVSYTLRTTLLSDASSPALADRALAAPGGVWDEPFLLPLDPDFLVQRTGYACLDESANPPNSVDEENARFFYNDQCSVETPDRRLCHRSDPMPVESCWEALTKHVGYIETAVRFTRIAWSRSLADEVRIGTSVSEPDLAVMPDKLANNRLVYRYIPDDSCAIEEKCISGSGWRRLLLFDASAMNTGDKDLVIGVSGAYGLFQYSACHKHFHFSHYAKFSLNAGQAGHKQAFCLQSTTRYSNNESTPLVSAFSSCSYQGISAGWGDDYIAGLDCQWIDVTGVGAGTATLTFTVNPDQFLCEGTPVMDSSGQPVFERYHTDDGQIVNRPKCNFTPGWQRNNVGSMLVKIPASGSYVTMPCSGGQVGPLRNCDFLVQYDQHHCIPGVPVSIHWLAAKPEIVRICEASATLGTGTACTYRQALANVIVTPSAEITFICPMPRNEHEPGGLYSLYTAPVALP